MSSIHKVNNRFYASQELREATAEVEAHWPTNMHTIIFYVLAEDTGRVIRKLGPLTNIWVFFFEGFDTCSLLKAVCAA